MAVQSRTEEGLAREPERKAPARIGERLRQRLQVHGLAVLAGLVLCARAAPSHFAPARIARPQGAYEFGAHDGQGLKLAGAALLLSLVAAQPLAQLVARLHQRGSIALARQLPADVAQLTIGGSGALV